MNLILLSQEDLAGDPDRAVLRGRRLRHVLEVHRARVGDRLRVGLVNGRVGTGVVTVLDAARLELEVTLDQDPPPPLPVTLLLALPRPKTLRRVLQCATAMGIKRIHLVNSWRVEKSFWASPALAPEKLVEECRLGLEQARDTVLPTIALARRFRPFVEDEARDIVRGTRALLAHPHALTPCPRALAQPVTLAIGPEGGFIPFELDLLSAHGFEPITLGPRPLRVEHALPALLGRLF
ncbi:MAG: 16S rRNA (uracil(1498)-N(3))-methyltransferase [Planctomycetota bacterium]